MFIVRPSADLAGQKDLWILIRSPVYPNLNFLPVLYIKWLIFNIFQIIQIIGKACKLIVDLSGYFLLRFRSARFTIILILIIPY